MVTDIVMAVTGPEPDIEITRVLDDAAGVLDAAAAADADVVIVMSSASTPETRQALLTRAPPRKVLEITDHGLTGQLHELRPARVALGELSASALLAAIRSARPPVPTPRQPRPQTH